MSGKGDILIAAPGAVTAAASGAMTLAQWNSLFSIVGLIVGIASTGAVTYWRWCEHKRRMNDRNR